MTIDKQKLKALAEAAKNWGGEIGEHRWYEAECFKQPYFSMPDAEFIGACDPATVLTLLAEIERLETQTRLAGVSAEVTVHQEVGRAVTRELALTVECDQLKAENERLTEDAARYRWLRNPENDVAILFGGHAWEDLSSEYMDGSIDAAIAKEASHG